MASTFIDVHSGCSACIVKNNGVCNVSPAALDALSAAKLTAQHPKASPLFGEGDMPRAVFCSGVA